MVSRWVEENSAAGHRTLRWKKQTRDVDYCADGKKRVGRRRGAESGYRVDEEGDCVEIAMNTRKAREREDDGQRQRRRWKVVRMGRGDGERRRQKKMTEIEEGTNVNSEGEGGRSRSRLEVLPCWVLVILGNHLPGEVSLVTSLFHLTSFLPIKDSFAK